MLMLIKINALNFLISQRSLIIFIYTNFHFALTGAATSLDGYQTPRKFSENCIRTQKNVLRQVWYPAEICLLCHQVFIKFARVFHGKRVSIRVPVHVRAHVPACGHVRGRDTDRNTTDKDTDAYREGDADMVRARDIETKKETDTDRSRIQTVTYWYSKEISLED